MNNCKNHCQPCGGRCRDYVEDVCASSAINLDLVPAYAIKFINENGQKEIKYSKTYEQAFAIADVIFGAKVEACFIPKNEFAKL